MSLLRRPLYSEVVAQQSCSDADVEPCSFCEYLKGNITKCKHFKCHMALSETVSLHLVLYLARSSQSLFFIIQSTFSLYLINFLKKFQIDATEMEDIIEFLSYILC